MSAIRELDGVELGQRAAESPGWRNVREDENGHAVDQAGQLIYDPRCYFCLNKDRDPVRQVTYVSVEFEASP
jgi:hypothetical protein